MAKIVYCLQTRSCEGDQWRTLPNRWNPITERKVAARELKAYRNQYRTGEFRILECPLKPLSVSRAKELIRLKWAIRDARSLVFVARYYDNTLDDDAYNAYERRAIDLINKIDDRLLASGVEHER